jgi:hypothetical protein
MSRRALRTDDDYAEAVYDHLRESGDVGDEAMASTRWRNTAVNRGAARACRSFREPDLSGSTLPRPAAPVRSVRA